MSRQATAPGSVRSVAIALGRGVGAAAASNFSKSSVRMTVGLFRVPWRLAGRHVTAQAINVRKVKFTAVCVALHDDSQGQAFDLDVAGGRDPYCLAQRRWILAPYIVIVEAPVSASAWAAVCLILTGTCSLIQFITARKR